MTPYYAPARTCNIDELENKTLKLYGNSQSAVTLMCMSPSLLQSFTPESSCLFLPCSYCDSPIASECPTPQINHDYPPSGTSHHARRVYDDVAAAASVAVLASFWARGSAVGDTAADSRIEYMERPWCGSEASCHRVIRRHHGLEGRGRGILATGAVADASTADTTADANTEHRPRRPVFQVAGAGAVLRNRCSLRFG